MNCSCVSHVCNPGCTCGKSDEFHRFTVTRITELKRDCFQHGYMFNINLAADLRYGD